MKTAIHTQRGLGRHLAPAGLVVAFLVHAAHAADPRTNSWFTTYDGQYARIYTNNLMLTNGLTLTTWSNGSESQTNPAYCGVQEVYSSSNWVYVRSTGLASYHMGPWLNGAFPNLPANQKLLYRVPRTNGVPAAKTENGGGQIGLFVDGVEMFNSWDAFYWNGTTDTSGAGTGYWNRDAYVNEGPTFDPGNAHQQNTGVYHYHANPIGLRYLLGDHVDYSPTAKTYAEATNAPTQHSPILGWVADGFPIYGPYGYANATNPASGIRRMVSGYVIRNGSYGTSNLTANGRTTIPQWAVRLTGVSSNQAGPSVSTSYPLGRYMEDNDYLGDLPNTNTGSNYQQSVDFDLDQYNGRYCVTPDFPNGTYAYFVAISASGAPVFPYNIGRGYYGSPAGGSVSSISETVATNFLGGPEAVPALNAPTVNNGTVTLTWSATEGGTYLVQSTTNLTTWTTNATAVSAVLNSAGYTNHPTDNHRFYRVARTALATYDSAGTGGYTPTISTVAPGGSATRGTTVTVTITLPATPPWPPAGAPLTSVTLAGSIAGTGLADSTQGQVVATFTIPAGAATGLQSVVAVFTSGPTYTVTGVTIN